MVVSTERANPCVHGVFSGGEYRRCRGTYGSGLGWRRVGVEAARVGGWAGGGG